MRKYIKILGAALAGIFIMSACTEQFEAPERYSPSNQKIEADLTSDGVTQIISIADLKQIFRDVYPISLGANGYPASGSGVGMSVKVERDVVIKGKVISSDWHGNVYRSLYIQDATGAIEIKVGLTGLFGDYLPGTWVYVKCVGLILGNYRHNLSLGVEAKDYPNGYIDLKANVENVLVIGEHEGITDADYKIITPTTAINSLDDVGRLVRLTNMESVWGQAVISGNTIDPNYYDTDIFPNYFTQKGSGTWAQNTYKTWTFLETIAAWKAWEDAGRPAGQEPEMPRPGTGTPDPTDPFINYPTWAFRNSTESWYGSSLFRQETSSNNYRNFTVRTSGYSTFALDKLPEPTSDTGVKYNIDAILNFYSNSGGSGKYVYQVLLNSLQGVKPAQ